MNWVEKAYKVKICGTTSVIDAKMASDAGADYSGVLVDVPISERSLDIDRAKSIVETSSIPVLILIMGKTIDEIVSIVNSLRPYGIHLLGQTPVELLRKLRAILNCQIWLTVYLPAKGQADVNTSDIQKLMVSYQEAGADAIVIDTVTLMADGKASRYGGTGKVADWDKARDLMNSVKIPIFLAGGINPDNVGFAIRKVDPYGVDLASGVEKSKGIRDPDKTKKLIQEVKKASRKSFTIISYKPEYTQDIGEKIGGLIFPGGLIALRGNLGSGKTVFAQGLAKGLGVKPIVTSPTFVIINEYEGRLPFYHIDTYRLMSTEEMQNLGYEEYFYGNGITIIEWADKVEELLPDEYLMIELIVLDEYTREITFIPYGKKYFELISQVFEVLNCSK
ncbi:tRNA (adenosine(37)-N6)-threonylcarbamoyltransferase complex ATPase subunit type 1 TsaE [Candidatus Poribacteria bacterium]|nr:tRNA (adenosine(37)-N6)-threonylcarbamoyltransferase complex ATPase subunit type 1 TsaE [Candidatus Poribacteria bacterium]